MKAESNATYPSHDIPFSEKDKAWCTRYMKAAWRENNTNATGIYNNGVLAQKAIRAFRYRNGKQPTSIYKKQWECDENGMSYEKLSFEIFQVLPKFADIAINKDIKRGYHPVAKAIDPLSGNMKRRFRWQKTMEMMLQSSGFFEAMAGIDPGIGPEGEVPESPEDLDMMMNVAYKLPQEVWMEGFIAYACMYNRYGKINEELVESIYQVGLAGVRRRTDKYGKINLRSMKARNLFLDYSEEEDFSDVRHLGEILYLTVSKLNEMSESCNDPLKQKQLRELAKRYSGKFGNPTFDNSWRQTYPDKSVLPYSNFKVPVLDLTWFSHGDLYINMEDTGLGYEKPVVSEEETEGSIKLRSQYVYEGYWVIGTDYSFGCGMVKNMARKTSDFGPTELPAKIEAPGMREGVNSSWVERLIPHADQIMLAWLKYQQAIRRIIPAGVLWDIDALYNIPKQILEDGTSKNYDYSEILQRLIQTGNMPYRGSSPDGFQKNSTPVEIHDSMGWKGAIEALNMIHQQIELMRQTSGLNEATDGSTIDQKTLVGVAEFMQSATSNATYTEWRALKNLNSRVFSDICLAVQGMEYYQSPELSEVYSEAIGSGIIGAMKFSGDISNYEFGIEIEDVMTPEEEIRFTQLLEAAVQNDQVTFDQSEKARGFKSIKARQLYLDYARKKYAAEKQQAQMQQAETESMLKMQEDQANRQAELAYEKAKGEIEVGVYARKKQIDLEYQKAVYPLDVDKLSRQQQAKIIDNEQRTAQNLEMKNRDIKGKIAVAEIDKQKEENKEMLRLMNKNKNDTDGK